MLKHTAFLITLLGLMLVQLLPLHAHPVALSNYTLTVVNGSGGGSYAAGTVITITANTPPPGHVFTDWTGAPVKNSTASPTTITMPAANTTVTANFATAYALTVVGGTGSGNYAAGTVVTITANSPPRGELFIYWSGTGVTFANYKASTTTITMPDGARTVTANFAPAFTLTVINGTGSGNYPVGVTASITANAAPAGEVFTKWTGATVANPTATSTTLTMPAANVTVTANYAATYTLTVVNGTGGGSFIAGTVVNITANAPPAGEVFTKWTGATVANPTASSTTLTMPAANTTVTANYAATYTLTVVNGTGGGNYVAGTVVTITANAPPAGEAFTKWTGATVANPNASSTTLTMPAAATTVTANYAASTYTLTVVNGTGGGNYASGTVVTITANAPPAGEAFTKWTGATVANPTAATTTITMPAAATTVTANYAATYTLTVVNGTGGGKYLAGAVVNITANAPPAGQAFTKWTGATVANPNASSTTLTMPAAATTVTANYAASTNTLTVVNGTGGGNYVSGTVVTITANAPPAGEVFTNWTGATVANPTAATTTITMPAAATTVTANYAASTYTLTVVNGTGGGNYAPGTVVTITANAPPAGQAFVDWTGATVANAAASSTTITMPAAATTVTATFGSSQGGSIPFPVTTHPRLWVTTADVPRLQSWASASNPIYAQGIVPLLNQTLAFYNQFFPNGQPNPNYPDDGDFNGYSPMMSEQLAVVLAFNSLIDPNPQNRITYAKYARNLLMYAINQAAQGTLAGAPFRDPLFCQSNRSNYFGEDWALTVDWIYNATDASGNRILTAADRATLQQVFLMWENILLTADATGGDHPVPVGATNSLSLIGNGTAAYRMASNNYYLGHARMMTMLALCIDPSDDPPVNPSLSVGTPGNSLRSFLLDANGAWLYQEYAMMGDPAAVAADYGIGGAGAGLGLASGGTPPEGVLYGHSFGYALGQMLALQTAGFNNINYTGPQVHLIDAPVWSRYVQSYLSAITPTSHVPAGEPWMGPVYQFATSGDTLRTWATPEQMNPISLLALLEQHQGSTTHTDAARWFDTNVPQGGLIYNVSNPFYWSTTQSLLAYMLFDPAAAPAADPRPSFPLTFFDPPQGQIYAHSDWTSNPTWFDYRASWESINHMQGDGGLFEFFRNGEWLTRGMSNYDSNWLGQTTEYHNTLGIQNWCQAGTPLLNWFEPGEWANGSQWNLGLNAGDPSTVMSTGTGYVYAASDLTQLYNRPDFFVPSSAALDVTQANRSILWLNQDYIVIYDRATTIHPNLFKTFNLSLVNSPVISGNVSTETMADGQKLFIQTLLPANPAITCMNGAANLSSVSDLEPTVYVMTVQNPALPKDARFLHVLQGANPGAAMAQAAYLTSTSGTPFDGAIVDGTAVYFPVATTSGLVATTFTAPAGVNTMYIAGLTPDETYGVMILGTASGYTVILTPNGTGYTADSAGLLKLTL